MSSYRLHKARQLAVVTLDGRNIYLGPYGSPESLREYDRVIQEWLANGRFAVPAKVAGQSGPGIGPTVSELILRYWAFVEE